MDSSIQWRALNMHSSPYNLTTNSTGNMRQNLTDLEGHIVSKTFQPGFVVLAYVVSFMGAWIALELINIRTAVRGTYNWILLAGASFSMGGIGTWCMHFIGNNAVVLGQGEPEIQIVYSLGFSTLSFLVPIAVIVVAFGAVNFNERFSKLRVLTGGGLQAFGLLCMHSLGQAGISNYTSRYDIAFALPAIFVAMAASIASLGLSHMFRTSWSSAWWQRGLCACVLSLGVSVMHWLASIGTIYELRQVNTAQVNNDSRHTTVIIIIVFSFLGCVSFLFVRYLTQVRANKSIKRAHQLVLVCMVFDGHGRLLVTPEGALPARKITDSWLEKTLNDVFSISHPVFLWIYRVSRNWAGVADIVPDMIDHVRRTGIRGRFGSFKDKTLLNDEGIPVSDFYLIFQELFCVTAWELANDLRQPLSQMGVLYEEIVNNGEDPIQFELSRTRTDGAPGSFLQDPERDVSGNEPLGKGQLLFLVNHVEKDQAEEMQAAGYRFAWPSVVVHIIASRLQMREASIRRRIDLMRYFPTDMPLMDSGMHLALFAVQASLGVGNHGFQILARRESRNLLPTMKINHVDGIEPFHQDFVNKMNNLTLGTCGKFVQKASRSGNKDKKEQAFAKSFIAALEHLKDEIYDTFYNDAVLDTKIYEAPCRGKRRGSNPGTAWIIAFQMIVPLHGRAPGKKTEFVPFTYLKMASHMYRASPDDNVFIRKTYDAFSELLQLSPERSGRASPLPVASASRSFHKPNRPGMVTLGSTKMRLWNRSRKTSDEEDNGAGTADREFASRSASPGNQFLTVEMQPLNFREGQKSRALTPAKDLKEQQTYIDELFKTTFVKRGFQF